MALFLLCGLILAQSQNWNEVATLVSDTSRDETILTVEYSATVTVGRPILIEARDTRLSEVYEVKHVYGNHILLKQRLASDFLAGSRVYQ
ncbi:MAG: hypothetical protein ACRD1R_09360 [Acidobacteriota bacterium]